MDISRFLSLVLDKILALEMPSSPSRRVILLAGHVKFVNRIRNSALESKACVIVNAAILINDQGKEHIGKQGEYIEHYPGYIKSDSHPDGYCLPCCFKQWNSQEQQARREDCSQKAAGIPITKHVKETSDDYIVGPDKFPIKQNRLGILPIIIQTFLKTDNQRCQISNTNIALKPDHLCLLRQGVQSSRHQSFVACISGAFLVHF